MILAAEELTTSLPTTWGGLALFAVGMIVWSYFQEKKKTPREASKAANLEEQTVLLREMVEQNRRSAKKAAKASKKSFRILKEVHGTVSEIRSDQKQKLKL